jgi:predicted phage terminase large subunit-like protein
MGSSTRLLTNVECDWLLSASESELEEWLGFLSTAEMDQALGELRAHQVPKERMEARLHEFVEQAWPLVEPDCRFIDGWHIWAICEHLEAVADGRIKRLLVNIPPGCSKSLLAAVFWPCWVWGPRNRPQSRWLFASYGQELSTRDSLKCRKILESDWYQSLWGDRVTLSDEQNQKTKFENSSGGWRLATSIDGRGTGEHPDFIVWDDPHNVNDAESQVERERVIAWRAATISLRGMTRDVREVGIMQRLHRDDLAGWMLKTHQESLDHLCLPMRYEEDAMRRPTSIGWTDPRVNEGELLWPQGIDEWTVTDKERQLGYHAEGQLQQRPPTRSHSSLFHGSYFDDNTIWFDELPPAKELMCKVVACDPKGSAPRQTETRAGIGDFCARVRVALHQSGTLYVDATLDHTDLTQAARRIFRDVLEFFGGCPVVGIAVEENFGQLLVTYELDKMLARGGCFVTIHTIYQTVNKYARIQNTLHWQLANSRVRFKRHSVGAALLVEQLRELPNGRYDDGPDALEMAVTLIRQLVMANYKEAT